MSTESIQNNLENRARLYYLEFHLTEHCNMNCKGCGHYSCVAEPEFASITQHSKDMKRLSEMVDIDCLRLLGGEPLLHPDIIQFMEISRKFFPKSRIIIATNAILLPTMSKEFWDAIANFRIGIDVTLYKPMWGKKEEIISLLKSHNRLGGEFNEVSSFFAKMDINGNQDYLTSYNLCKYKKCYFLEAGKMATCSFPFTKRHFNKKFGLALGEVDNDGIIDIHDPKLNGETLVKRMNTPPKICRYCTKNERYFDWDISKTDMYDWSFAGNPTLKV